MIRELLRLLVAPDLTPRWQFAWRFVLTAVGMVVIGAGLGVIWGAIGQAIEQCRWRRDPVIGRDQAKPRPPFTSAARRVR